MRQSIYTVNIPPPRAYPGHLTPFYPWGGEFDLFNRYRGGAFDINPRDVGHLTTK